MGREWLSALKAGDTVVVASGGSFRSVNTVRKVERLTKTQVVIKGDTTRYRRADGRSIGDHGFYSAYLLEPTNQNVAAAIRGQLEGWVSQRLFKLPLTAMSDDKLRRLYELLKEPD